MATNKLSFWILKWKYNGAQLLHIAPWKRRFNTVPYLHAHMALLSSHVWENPPKKTETIKHRPTPWRNVIHGVCVCFPHKLLFKLSHFFWRSLLPLHSLWCYHGYILSAEVIFSICELTPQADPSCVRGRPLSQDGSYKEEWGILWQWIFYFVSAKEDYVFGIALVFWNINTPCVETKKKDCILRCSSQSQIISSTSIIIYFEFDVCRLKQWPVTCTLYACMLINASEVWIWVWYSQLSGNNQSNKKFM